MGQSVNLDQIPPEILILLAAGLVLLVATLLAIILVRKRHRKVEPRSSKLERIFAAYKQTHPAFSRIMASFQEKHDLNELLQRGDVRAAVRLLEARKPGKQGGEASVLALSGPSEEDTQRKVQAAMVTILRAIYMDESFRGDLSSRADSELDRLLESLTG